VDKDTRNTIERATQKARKLLSEDFAEQLVGTFDIHPSGDIGSKAGAHLSPAQVTQRDKIVAALEHKRTAGMDAKAAVSDYVRDAAFTTLNRFAALKMLEARQLVQVCVTKGEQSSGYLEFCGMAPGVGLLPEGRGYRLYLESLFDELSTEVKVLFDRRDPASVLWPGRTTLEQLLSLLNDHALAEVWGEDETIGWVYQFFNGGDERKAMRDASQAPRNSRELAVRNQFFTPRYVVEFLTDNTLGRIWWEMRSGRTALADMCPYMVRKRNEVFLGEIYELPGSQPWLGDVTRNDFAGIPENLPWAESFALAGVLGRYLDETDWERAGKTYFRLLADHRATGEVSVSTTELREAFAYSHEGNRKKSEKEGAEDTVPQAFGDALCRALGSALRAETARGAHLDNFVLIPPRTLKDPRDIRVLDPACGSGHFLLYAFDLLAKMYAEAWQAGERSPPSQATGKTMREDYPVDVDMLRALPALILRHNLHGVDIDPRCAQIAQLALWMRAQREYATFNVTRGQRPIIRRSNIVVAEPLAADEATLKEFLAELKDEGLARVFKSVVETLGLAGDLGLLLRVEELFGKKLVSGEQTTLFAPPRERIRATLTKFVAGAGRGGARRRLFAEDAVQGMGLLETAEKKFDVVLMNPPFGAGSLRGKAGFEKAYPRTKNDVYAAFVERGIELTVPRGRVGAITSRTGFFLSSFQKWREEIILKTAPPVVFADLGAGVLDSAMVETAAYCLEVGA
jgi:hypothetical protein